MGKNKAVDYMKNALGDDFLENFLDDQDNDLDLLNTEAEDEEPLTPVTETTSLKQTLFEMFAGMLLWGVLCELAGVWWVQDKLGCSLGLWAGILIAAGMAAHIAYTINTNIDLPQKAATSRVRLRAIIRYIVVLGLFAAIIFSKFINPLTAFLGVMSLKISAYLQPFSHKIFKSLKK